VSEPTLVMTLLLTKDATPLRKVAAAASWRRDVQTLLDHYVAEARDAGMRQALIDLALGEAFDVATWHEALATMNEEEQGAARREMREMLGRGGRDDE
jgi:predicted DsbA family dithiol-disulfide isomerase